MIRFRALLLTFAFGFVALPSIAQVVVVSVQKDGDVYTIDTRVVEGIGLPREYNRSVPLELAAERLVFKNELGGQLVAVPLVYAREAHLGTLEATGVVPWLPTMNGVEVQVAGNAVSDEAVISEPTPFLGVSVSRISIPGRLSILLLADGFSGQGLPYAHAIAFRNMLLGVEPFRSLAARIDFQIFESRELGCSITGRLLLCRRVDVIAEALRSGLPHNEIIAIHASSVYAGSGWLDVGGYETDSVSSFAQVTIGLPTDMWLHEFGHSFGSLLDGYYYANEPWDPNPPAAVNCVSSCALLAPYAGVCNSGCGRNANFVRAENDVMFSIGMPYFNRVSIESRAFPYGLRKRLEFFAGSSAPGCPVPGSISSPSLFQQGSFVSLTWNPAARAASYGVVASVGNVQVGNWSIPVPGLSGTADPGTYQVQITAHNSCGPGPSTNVTVTVY